MTCAAILESLPLVYSSLEQHQVTDSFCQDIRSKINNKSMGAEKFLVRKNRLCFFPKSAKRCRWVVPLLLRPMLLQYFHDSALAGHVGAFKTFHKIANNFWWPRMRN